VFDEVTPSERMLFALASIERMVRSRELRVGAQHLLDEFARRPLLVLRTQGGRGVRESQRGCSLRSSLRRAGWMAMCFLFSRLAELPRVISGMSECVRR
jgi:hypothetical protein